MMTGLVTTGYLSGLTTPYYMGITFVGGHMCWQIWTAQLNENVNLWNRFSSNAYIGGLIAASIIAGHFEYNTLVR
jgi:4-hydroxybenzoate polyprenyltransferase